MPLAPEHLSDLKASGLTDDTINACRYASVRPHDIKLPDVNSAYRITYFDLDGQPNSVERWKLFPPIVRPDGKQKYHQPKGTAPHLYFPPLCNWQEIASDPRSSLTITEGEKKAAALSQHGIPTIGIAGCWSHSQRDDTGERLMIPTVDQIIWKDRDVELIPDSDVWRPDKQQALSGFYALGMELVRRGATVRFVVLPEAGQGKVGLDDFLVKSGAQWKEFWPSLERITLDNPRLVKMANWWQGWREKRVLQHSLQQASHETMEVVDLAGHFEVSFPDHHTALSFQRLSENARGVSAELTITVGHLELLGDTDIGLKSDSSRDKLARSLSRSAIHIPWKRLLERACAAVLKRHRHGEPIIELEPRDSIHTPFVLNPIVYRGHQTLIFAPGGSYKSYLALYIALLAMAGQRQNGVAAIQTNVLYLDWELDQDTVGARLKALHVGHPELASCRPYYRRCTQPLHLDAAQLAAEVAQRHIGLVIVDSAALACGGDLHSPESAIKLQQTLRRIGCASIVLAHVSKSTVEGQDKSAYGTVFFRELARNVWELSRPEGCDRVVLSQTGTSCKNSFGPKQGPLGFALLFSHDQVKVSSFNPADENESGFEDKLPLRDRMQHLLSDKTPRSSKEIADELHAFESSVKSTLSTHRQLFTRSGSYHKGTWTLASSAQAPIQSLKSIVEPSIVDASLQSLNGNGSSQRNYVNSNGKPIVEGIVDDRCTPSLLKQGGYINTAPSTINDSTIKNLSHSQAEEIINLC